MVAANIPSSIQDALPRLGHCLHRGILHGSGLAGWADHKGVRDVARLQQCMESLLGGYETTVSTGDRRAVDCQHDLVGPASDECCEKIPTRIRQRQESDGSREEMKSFYKSGCSSNITTTLLDQHGIPFWFGDSRRSPTQRDAVSRATTRSGPRPIDDESSS